MRINHNISALNAYRQLTVNNNASSKNLERLSSGLRINRGGDDAAGLSISEKMRAQIKGLDTAAKNCQDGISLIQTAEGALTETHSILQRMRELAMQASNDIYTADDRTSLQTETDALIAELDRIGGTTQFNGINILDGSLAAGGTPVVLQAGPNGLVAEQITVAIEDMTGSGAELAVGGVLVDSVANAQTGIASIDLAIQNVSTQRSDLGAIQNRLEHTVSSLSVSSENLTAAESRIRDVDMAKEMVEFTKNSILMQSAQAMLAQANTMPQNVLQLLR
jgi:flagellin